MNIPQLAKVIDLLALSFVFGATTWFFFLQSPVLLKKLGREKFVPIQMQLTSVLFRALSVALLIMLVAASGHSPIGSVTIIAAGIAVVAGLINRLVVVPRALKAGSQSRREIKGKDSEGSTASFASVDAGVQTQLLHRLVVLLVVLMLGGVVMHGISMLVA